MIIESQVGAWNRVGCRRENECYILEELPESNETKKALSFIFLLASDSDWIISHCSQYEHTHLFLLMDRLFYFAACGVMILLSISLQPAYFGLWRGRLIIPNRFFSTMN